MYGDYLVMCGMVWAQFGKQDAGLELIRALDSPDQDVRVLARTLLAQAGEGSKQLIGEALALNEISVDMAQLCAFEQAHQLKQEDPSWSVAWAAEA
jgi:HEAT repeat protein